MDLLKKISKYPVFNVELVEKLTGNLKTAYSAIRRLIKNGYVVKVRSNIYSTVDLSTGLIVANRYQIACAISVGAYISNHTALEYQGLTNQVFNEVYVSSSKRFNPFTYDGITYKYVKPKIDSGVITAKNTFGVRVTDTERTMLDSIYQINKITGLEALVYALDNIGVLNEDKLILYLNQYDIKSLYQKTGYLLDKYQDKFHLSNTFFDFCKSNINNSISYLVDKDTYNFRFNKTWRLMEPIQPYEGDDEIV